MNKSQKKYSEAVRKIDKKYKIKRDLQLSFTQLMEEIGELAQEINKPKLRNKNIDHENLKGEFADALLQIFILADMLKVDLDQALKEKYKILKERHNI